MGKTALVAGAGGLVGGHLLRQLLQDPGWDHVVSLGRRRLELGGPKLREVVVDFEKLEESAGKTWADAAFCCLGTTLKKAGSRPAFERIDKGYILSFARLAKASGVNRFILVSSAGADARSGVFYSRIKGEIEEEVGALGFAGLDVLRPSVLLGERAESRPLERLAMGFLPLLSPLMVGPLAAYQPVQAEDVARAMRGAALLPPLACRVITSDRI